MSQFVPKQGGQFEIRGEPEAAHRHASAAAESFRALGLGHFERRAERLLASASPTNARR